MDSSRLNKQVARIVNMEDEGSDFAYWQSVPYEKRLEALENIRNEYIGWKYGSEQRFQRVYRIVKLQ